MAQKKYFVGIDMASSTFTAAAGTTPWKVVLRPQEFENSEDGFQALLEWLAQHRIPAGQSVVCMVKAWLTSCMPKDIRFVWSLL